MSMVHRYAESQRRVSELKAQIAVMRVGYNGALKERDQLRAELARSVNHGQGVVEISNGFAAERNLLQSKLDERANETAPCRGCGDPVRRRFPSQCIQCAQ